MKHSPTPWKVFTDAEFPGVDASNGDAVILYGSTVDGDGVRGETNEQAEANAALIVACVNAVCEAAAIAGVDPVEYAKNLPQREYWNQQTILAAAGATATLRRMQEANNYKNQQRAEHGDAQ